jgi:LysM repeat protein
VAGNRDQIPSTTRIRGSIRRPARSRWTARRAAAETRPDATNPGDSSGEATPVPIPNTEVKLSSAEDTERAAFRENRSSPGLFAFRGLCWNATSVSRDAYVGSGRHSAILRGMSAVEAVPQPVPSIEPGTARVPRWARLPTQCPYLSMPDGNWRSSTATHEHRCTAVSPPVQLSLEKQRRLCLDESFVGCATYGVALAARAGPSVRVTGQSRPIARMTPVILDRGRFDLRIPSLRAGRPGQAVLVGILGIAFVVILLGRPAGDGAAGPTFAAGGSAPAVTGAVASIEPGGAAPTAVVADATPTSAATNERSETAVPSAGPTRAPSTAPSPAPSGQPATSGATYRVKSGDTLSGIAKRFGTTTRVLADLNGIADPAKIRIGRILRLP